MRFDGIDMKGYFKPQEVNDLPLPDPDEERRVVYNKSDKRIYYNDGQNWIPLGESEIEYQIGIHGDEKHAETYIKEGDIRLIDSRPPLLHGDNKHTETYIKDTDTRLTDSRIPKPHAEVHSLLGEDPLIPTDIGAETSVNKVISWSDNPSHDNYPSEKLVKDTIDLITSIDELDFFRIGNNFSEIFTEQAKLEARQNLGLNQMDGGTF
jgi:hypothetical protein